MPGCCPLRCFGSGSRDDEDENVGIGPGRLEYPVPTRLEELGDRNPILQSPSDPETHKKMLAITNGVEDDVDDDRNGVSNPVKHAPVKAPITPRPFQLEAAVVTATPGVTVSGLQPVQIFEGSMFQPNAVADGAKAKPPQNGHHGPQFRDRMAKARRSRDQPDALLEDSESANADLHEDDAYLQQLEEATEMIRVTALQLCRASTHPSSADAGPLSFLHCDSFSIARAPLLTRVDAGCGQLLREEGSEDLAEKCFQRAIMVDAQSLLALRSYQELLESKAAYEESEGLRVCAESVLDVILSALEEGVPEEATREDIMEFAVQQQHKEAHRLPLPRGHSSVQDIADALWDKFRASSSQGVPHQAQRSAETGGGEEAGADSDARSDMDAEESGQGLEGSGRGYGNGSPHWA